MWQAKQVGDCSTKNHQKHRQISRGCQAGDQCAEQTEQSRPLQQQVCKVLLLS